jgi:O-antigen biosynthesis protein
MQLTVIIVNFNVKYFLEQCLCSLLLATKEISTQIIVVDNNSKDDSINYLQPKFNSVNFIALPANVGFAKANNIALQQANGELVLFLNPDTIVTNTTILACWQHIKNTNNCGAVGVQMVDGMGVFLPESKRSFPSVSTSFYKLFGLSSLLPKSKKFNKYALGNLDKNKVHKVDVLCGAFMMMENKIAQQCNGFDESFFMYGEDIDLSYRIIKLGFHNYYLGNNSIIHFKGESTKRGSLNYIKMFYNAMLVFVNKHYSGSQIKLYSFFIKMAILFRASMAMCRGFIKKTGLPILDFLIVYFSVFLVEKNWVHFIRNNENFINSISKVALPSFSIIYLFGAIFNGIYDDNEVYKPSKLMTACASAIIITLAAYSLLPESYRFSRGVILIGGCIATIFVLGFRKILIGFKILEKNENTSAINTAIIANDTQYKLVEQVLKNNQQNSIIIGKIDEETCNNTNLGSLKNLVEIVRKYQIKELIFYLYTGNMAIIISKLNSIKLENVEIKFMVQGATTIVGSNNKNTVGTVVANKILYNIELSLQRKMKTVIDFFVAIFVVLFMPFICVISKHPMLALKNAISVLLQSKTWVGYCTTNNILPQIKPGILCALGKPFQDVKELDIEICKKIDTKYALEYDWFEELKLIIKNTKHLGSK